LANCRAPYTLVTVVNNEGRMVPAAAFLTSDTTAVTYKNLLAALKEHVEQQVFLFSLKKTQCPLSNGSPISIHHPRM
jgi:hypothetical protein